MEMVGKDVEVVIKVENGKILRCGRYHPEVYVHPGDRVVWTCADAAFRISNIHKAEDCCDCPDSPFAEFNNRKIDPGGTNRSGPVLEEAEGHLYKSTWKVYDKAGKMTDCWDPHIHVGEPDPV